MLVFLAIGVQQLWDIVARTYALKIVAAIAITIVAIVGRSRVASLTEAQAKLPWENEKFVAELAKATGLNYVFTDSTHPGALYYYMGENHVVAMHADAVEKQAYCAVKSRFIFVDDQYHQVVAPNIKCLTDRKAVKIEVPQQLYPPIRRPGAVTVYLVPATKHKKHKPKAKAKAKVHATTTTTTRPS